MNGFISLTLVAAFSGVAAAQTVAPAPSAPGLSSSHPLSKAPAPPLTGQLASDLIPLSGPSFGLALKHGNLIAGSEHVTLNGIDLVEGSGYTIDDVAGVIYLQNAPPPNSSLVVTYRFDPSKASTAPVASSGFSGFSFGLLPGGLSSAGSLNMTLGLGLTERNPDGSVLRSNVFGWNNNMHFGGGSTGGTLTGVLLMGQRDAQNVYSNFGAQTAASPTDLGKSELMIEGLQTKALGGNFSANYQDISQNFSQFSALGGNGFNQAQIDALSKQKGLKQIGLDLANIGTKSFNLTAGYRSISNGQSGLQFNNYGLVAGGLNLNWQSQKIDSTFNRFADLSDADKVNFQREAGTTRDLMTGSYAIKNGTLGFSNLDIEDNASHGHIQQQSLDFKDKSFNFDFGSQKVDSQYTDFNALLDPEKPLFTPAAGLRKQWGSLGVAASKLMPAFSFSDNKIQSNTGDFASSALGLVGKNWSASHFSLSADPGFASFGAVALPDMDSDITQIAHLYQPTLPVNAAAERAAFQASAGITRSGTQFDLQPTNSSTLAFSDLSLKGPVDGGGVQSATFTDPVMNFSYRHETIGDSFTQLQSLMGFEKQQLGTVQGLDQSSVAFNWKVDKNKSIQFDNMLATTATGGAKHQSLSFTDPNLVFHWNLRQVDPQFTNVGQIADPQAPLLSQLVGLSTSAADLSWTLSKQFKITANQLGGSSYVGDQTDAARNVDLNYTTKLSSLDIYHHQQSTTDPTTSLFGNTIDKVSLEQALGPDAKIHVEQEHQTFSGTDINAGNLIAATAGVSLQLPPGAAQGSVLEDFTRRTVGVDLKLSKETSVSTEQTQTNYSSGQQETVLGESLTTQLSKNAGVTLSDTTVNGLASSSSDQSHRNYGFWYDFGKGVKLSYGYVRQFDAVGTNATSNSLFSFGATPTPQAANLGATPEANLGGVGFAGGYATNEWQTYGASGAPTERTQAFSNVRLNLIKPMNIGLLKNFTFNVSHDTAADNYNWIKQDDMTGFSGQFLGGTFGFQYHSQVDPQGDKAVDRAFAFSTDPKSHALLSANMLYKVRTLPLDQRVMIRNFAVTLRPSKSFSITNSIMTNPEVMNTGVILGSVTQGARDNKWAINWAGNKTTDFGASWEDQYNELNKAAGQTAGVNLTLFKLTSPLKLFYGIENTDNPSIHQITERYSIEFDQRAGPNQSFSFFVGNLDYGYTIPAGQSSQNWTARVDYQWRF